MFRVSLVQLLASEAASDGCMGIGMGVCVCLRVVEGTGLVYEGKANTAVALSTCFTVIKHLEQGVFPRVRVYRCLCSLPRNHTNRKYAEAQQDQLKSWHSDHKGTNFVNAVSLQESTSN